MKCDQCTHEQYDHDDSVHVQYQICFTFNLACLVFVENTNEHLLF